MFDMHNAYNIGVGSFVACFTGLGNARALICGMSNVSCPAFFIYILFRSINKVRLWAAPGKSKNGRASMKKKKTKANIASNCLRKAYEVPEVFIVPIIDKEPFCVTESAIRHQDLSTDQRISVQGYRDVFHDTDNLDMSTNANSAKKYAWRDFESN